MRTIISASILLLSASFLAIVVHADEESAPPSAYTWENQLVLEAITNFHGTQGNGTRYLGNLDITLTLDTQAAGWWKNGTFFVYGLGDWGQNPSEMLGVYQTISNIEAPNAAKIYEFWYEHSFLNGDLKWLVGLYNHNAAFYALDSAALFSESTFGIGPEVAQVSPSIFPTTAMTSLFKIKHNNWYANIAFYDGVPGDPNNPRGTHVFHTADEGLFNAQEFGFDAEGDLKVGVGFWQHSQKKESPIDGSLMSSNSGHYLIAQKYFTEDFAAFVQWGMADASKNQLSQYRGTGFTHSNYFMKGDQLGLSYAHAVNSPKFLENNPDYLASETVMELAYLWPLDDSIGAKVSVFNIQNPGMEKDKGSELAAGLRLNIKF